MTVWLSVSLKEDLKRLVAKIRLPPSSSADSADTARRVGIVETAAVLPGLRMAERRRLILLAQSAPAVELAALSEVLMQLSKAFAQYWQSDEVSHETILDRVRQHLSTLDVFATQLGSTYERRDAAAQVLEELEAFETPRSLSMALGFEPVYSYVGYEVETLLPILRERKYPEALGSPRPMTT